MKPANVSGIIMCAESSLVNIQGLYLKRMQEASECENNMPSTGAPLLNSNVENLTSSVSAACKAGPVPQKQTSSNGETDYSWMLCLNSEYLNYKKCKCTRCLRQFITFPSEKKHVKKLIHAWTTVRDLIRAVYMNPPIDTVKKSQNILEEKEWIREVVQWLRMTEPYQLLQKIEDEVIAFVLVSRSQLLSLIVDESVSSMAGEVFATGLIEEYVKLLSSALYISPLIEALLSPQLINFNLTWEMLNKHLYLLLIYLHEDVKKMWPICFHQLKKALNSTDVFFQQLFEQFMTLDREMELVDEKWQKIEPLIENFRISKSRETVALKKLQAVLKERLSQVAHEPGGGGDEELTCTKGMDCNQIDSIPWPEFCRSVSLSLNSNPMSLDGYATESSDSPSGSRSDSAQRSRTSSESAGDAEDPDLMEQSVECECHVCSTFSLPDAVINEEERCAPCDKSHAPGHGEGFLLYPHIHGKSECSLSISENFMASNAAHTAVSIGSNCQENDGANLDDTNHRPTRSNPYLLSEYSHLYSVLSNEDRPPLLLKALTGTNIPVGKDRRKDIKIPKLSACHSVVDSPTNNLEENFATLKETAKPLAERIPYPESGADADDYSPESPKPEACSVDPENHLTPEEVSKAKIAFQKRKMSLAKEKMTGKQKTVATNTKPGGTCQKPGVCVKCTKPGTSCNKSAEKRLAAIARLGISKYSSKHTSRCSEHSKCRLSEDPNRKCSSGADFEWADGDDVDGFSSQEDTCSERSNSTCTSNSTTAALKDPKHCDCCYCEVFGHAVQTVAPVSRNYQETRERLRLRLNMKKKSKTNPQTPAPQQTRPPTIPAAAAAGGGGGVATLPVATKVTLAPSQPAETTKSKPQQQDLNTLLQFIEGNIKDDLIDEKKLAKRARQKQKKQDEKDEKERQEREAERMRLEALKKMTKKDKKAAKKERQREAASGAAAAKAIAVPPMRKAIDCSISKSGPGTKMVTIRRVMEPYQAEPTVTITIKGASPDKDKVLFSPNNVVDPILEASKKKKKKSKKMIEMDISDVPPVHKKRVMEIINSSNNNGKTLLQESAKKNLGDVPTKSQRNKILINAENKSLSQRTENLIGNGNSKPHVTLSKVPKPNVKLLTMNGNSNDEPFRRSGYTNAQQKNEVTVSSGGRPVYHLSQILNPVTQHVQEELKLEDLKLPPGITITKIETPKPKVIRACENPGAVTRPSPLAPPLVVSHGAPPRVVTQSEYMQPTSQSSTAGNVIVVETGHLKQVMKENGITISVNEATKKKKKKNKGGTAAIASDLKCDTLPIFQQATIIKTSDNMVTIRSPQLQHAIDMQSGSVNGVTDSLKRVHLDAESHLTQQMTRLTLADARASISAQQDNKKKKKRRGKGNGADEDADQPENVFEPKDIDLENGDMDDDEREVEAFKRFCLQSVPAARKDKVKVNLNIKDIVLKKKSSAIGCS